MPGAEEGDRDEVCYGRSTSRQLEPGAQDRGIEQTGELVAGAGAGDCRGRLLERGRIDIGVRQFSRSV